MPKSLLAFASLCFVVACGAPPAEEEQGTGEAALGALSLPGVVEAEAFSAGAEGTAYHDTTAKNLGGAYRLTSSVDIEATAGGYDVGWIAAGEWLEYDVSAAQTATFAVSARVASAVAGTKAFHFDLDGKTVAQASFTDASGWQSFSTVAVGSFAISAGAHRLRFVAETAGFNVDSMKFTAATTSCSPRFAGDPSCSGKIYFGASIEGNDPAALEAKVGNKLGVHRSYMHDTDAASKFVSQATTDLANGRVPLISTKVPGTWAAVAAGASDAWLLERIRALAAMKGPVWLCLHHEPTGDGPPADWVKMQQHARKLIDANSKNIALVGILNGWAFLERNPHPEDFNHPVGSGVHVMGFDSYNGWSPTNGQAWKAATEVFSPGVTIASWGYPTLVGEYGVRTDPSSPGKAAQWMRDAYNFALAHHFVGMSYFDSGQNSPDGTWMLDAERTPAFGANLARPESAHL